jgi:hypothetical protein
MAATQTTANTNLHPFERAGLGKAPFRFVGIESQDLAYGQVCLNREEFDRTGILLSTKPGGTCAYCGASILVMFNVESSDGQRFHVGCDCVEKCARAAAGTDQERELARLLRPIRDAKNARSRELRAAREAATKARLATTAADRHGALLARLDAAAAEHPAFGRMAADLRAGKAANLTAPQIAWLERTESAR